MNTLQNIAALWLGTSLACGSADFAKRVYHTYKDERPAQGIEQMEKGSKYSLHNIYQHQGLTNFEFALLGGISAVIGMNLDDKKRRGY